MNNGRLLVIGCGNIGGAIIDGLIKAESYVGNQIVCCDLDEQKLSDLKRNYGVLTETDPILSIDEVDIVLLAVKPIKVSSILKTLVEKIKKRNNLIIISVAAGVKLSTISDIVGKNVSIIRVMPNLPCTIGKGISAIYGNEKDAVIKAEQIFESVGECVICSSEADLDAVTGLSGSGPAFVFTIIEALAQGGVNMGLTPDIANKLATVTVYGSAAMLLQLGEHPAVLRDKVTTPGGTTIKGLKALEDGGMRSSLIAAVEAATLRARNMD